MQVDFEFTYELFREKKIEELIVYLYPLVNLLSWRFSQNGLFDVDDLKQSVLLALLEKLPFLKVKDAKQFSKACYQLIIDALIAEIRNTTLVAVDKTSWAIKAAVYFFIEDFHSNNGCEPSFAVVQSFVQCTFDRKISLMDFIFLLQLRVPAFDLDDVNEGEILEFFKNQSMDLDEALDLKQRFYVLTELERQVVDAKYFRALSHNQIAKALGLTRCKVRNIELEAMRKMRII